MAVHRVVASAFQRFVWTRETLLALVSISPAVLAAAGSFAMSSSVDAEIAGLSRQKAEQIGRMSDLDTFLRDVERYQLDRAAFLLMLAGENSEMALRYRLDKLFRINAMGAMRRVAATLYPVDWPSHLKRYEELLQPDYAEKATIDELQSIESSMIADAGKALTSIQADISRIADTIDEKSATRTTILTLGNALMYILTVLLFFLKTNWSPLRARPGASE